MISYKNYDVEQLNKIQDLSKQFNISYRFCKILFGRGIDTEEKIDKFLNPSKNNFHDAFLLKGMAEAVDRITQAKENNEVVVVYGDYDADGICSTTTLISCLKEFGIEAIAVIPERVNGYGLSQGVIEKVMDRYYPDLIITVDCGISGYNEVEELQNLGVDVIVTDHHEVPSVLPNCITINCKIKEQDYPFEFLCGTAVAYKLGYALIGEKANSYLDYVAVATIADSMPLIGENRDLVYEGLKLFSENKAHLPLKAIWENSGNKEVNATNVAFGIAPRINAAGRMGDAYSALCLCLSENKLEINNLAKKLGEYNANRQGDCKDLYEDAKRKLKSYDLTKPIIVLEDSKWNNGLVGITCSKIVEEYSRPAILFVNNNGILHGSARSTDKINVYEAISYAKEYVVAFGGHAQAGGVTLEYSNLQNFIDKISEYLTHNYDYSTYLPTYESEELINENISLSFAEELNLLEPCGVGNRKPVFSVEVNDVAVKPLKIGSPHYSIKTNYLDLIYFNGVDSLELIKNRNKKTVLFELNVSTFNGIKSLKGYVKYLCLDEKQDKDEVKLSVFNQNLKLLTKYEKLDTVKVSKEYIQKLIEASKKDIFGTVFLADSLEVLSEYEGLENLPISLYSSYMSSNINCVIVGVKNQDLTNYKSVVFLNKTYVNNITVSKDSTIYECEEVDCNSASELSLKREDFAKIYSALLKVEGATSVNQILQNINLDYSKKQIIFALNVFLELKFFNFLGGSFFRSENVKRPLTDSIIYNKINDILKV